MFGLKKQMGLAAAAMAVAAVTANAHPDSLVLRPLWAGTAGTCSTKTLTRTRSRKLPTPWFLPAFAMLATSI